MSSLIEQAAERLEQLRQAGVVVPPVALAPVNEPIGTQAHRAFAASQLRPVYERASELREKVNLPVLGMVSLVLSDPGRRRERFDRVRFLAVSSTLFLAFAALLVATTIAPRS